MANSGRAGSRMFQPNGGFCPELLLYCRSKRAAAATMQMYELRNGPSPNHGQDRLAMSGLPARKSIAAMLFFHPSSQLVASIVLVTASEVLLKRGATETANAMPELSWLGIGALSSGAVWLGIICIILSLVSWLHVLRSVDLSLAYSVAGSIYALVPVASWVLLGEAISVLRWLGIGLVAAGILVIVPDMKKTEPAI